jgi:hypothetical protein
MPPNEIKVGMCSKTKGGGRGKERGKERGKCSK